MVRDNINKILILFSILIITLSLYSEECELIGTEKECLKKTDCYTTYEGSIYGELGSAWSHRGRKFGLGYGCEWEEKLPNGAFECHNKYVHLANIPESHRWLFKDHDIIRKIDKCPSKFSSSRANEMSIYDSILMHPNSIQNEVNHIQVERYGKKKVLDVKLLWKYHNEREALTQQEIVEIEKDEKIDELNKKKQERSIFRKVFFFWEWGDYWGND